MNWLNGMIQRKCYKGDYIMQKETLDTLRKIRADLNAIISQLEAEVDSSAKIVKLGIVRRFAVLDEVYRLGGIVTPEKLSELAQKYGRTGSSAAGYFRSEQSSLEKISEKERKLTSHGLDRVMKCREDWGEDWIDKIDMSLASNPNVSINISIQI